MRAHLDTALGRRRRGGQVGGAADLVCPFILPSPHSISPSESWTDTPVTWRGRLDMAGAAAALLDELMGRSRNVLPGKETQETDWSDAEVPYGSNNG